MKKKLMKRNIKIINNVSILVNITISLNNSNNSILGCSLLNGDKVLSFNLFKFK